VALEKVALPDLDTLSLQPIHPAAVVHLRPQLAYGATPASARRWRNIKSLTVEMDGFSFGLECPSDHLKLLHTYLGSFPLLESLAFRWNRSRGPSPLSLHAEPCIAASRVLDCSVACPNASAKPPLTALKFRHLKTMLLENAITDAAQISGFIMSHRKVLHDFHFENVRLRSGDWDDALAPLTRISGSENWKKKQEEVMDVPLILSPTTTDPPDCVDEMLWGDERKRRGTLEALRKASLKTKEMLGAGPEHLRRLLRSSFLWR